MKKRKLWLIALASAIAAGAIAGGVAITSAGADAGQITLRAYDEVPALSVPPAFGEFRIRINDATQTITFGIRWTGLTGPPLFSHIHIGQPGVNGGVSAFLCGGSTKPACPQSTTGSVNNGTIVPADVIGPSGQGVNAGEWSELVAAIRAGRAYANLHTNAFPGGEIRGQIVVS